MVSPKVKFIAMTIDELILVPLVIFLVYFFAPEYLFFVIIITLVGAAIFVLVKFYLVFPTMSQEQSYSLYDLSGVTGKVTKTVTPTEGKVKVGQEIWDARCDEGEIPVGTEIQVVARESFRVKVAPKESQW
ncbi:MAG: NfeD family protein [Candidatus Thorarchaeota archaeon]|nr:NfeD family protein [Candidatus Thorarchaeota archaeon]